MKNAQVGEVPDVRHDRSLRDSSARNQLHGAQTQFERQCLIHKQHSLSNYCSHHSPRNVQNISHFNNQKAQ